MSPPTFTQQAVLRSSQSACLKQGCSVANLPHRHRTNPRRRSRASEGNAGPGSRPCKSNPLKPTGGLVILKGNLAPEGCVVKVAGHNTRKFRGPARVFDSEEAALRRCRRQADQSRRRGGDPLRRTPRRAGNAGNAGRHGRAGRRRPGRFCRVVDRRAILRRNAWADGRTRCPGSRERWPHRRRREMATPSFLICRIAS